MMKHEIDEEVVNWLIGSLMIATAALVITFSLHMYASSLTECVNECEIIKGES